MKEWTVKEKPLTRLTFALLDQQKGFGKLPPLAGEEFPLPAWYRAVCETPLEELGVEDVSKACRQQIHLEHVVPLALRILEADPLAGELYDGELLLSLRSVPSDYWPAHADEVSSLKPIVETVCRNAETADDLRRDARALLTKLP